MERHCTYEAIVCAVRATGLPVALHADSSNPLSPPDRYYIHAIGDIEPQVLRALKTMTEEGVLVLPYPNSHRKLTDP